jgi:hypothetical protein
VQGRIEEQTAQDQRQRHTGNVTIPASSWARVAGFVLA